MSDEPKADLLPAKEGVTPPEKFTIYVASSWRNNHQQSVVEFLRGLGHDVYDFKNPEPGNKGFGWSEIDPNWRSWTPEQYVQALEHPIAQAGHKCDYDAMKRSDLCVAVHGFGNSASFEAGWFSGRGSYVIHYLPEIREPELMYLTPPAIFALDLRGVERALLSLKRVPA